MNFVKVFLASNPGLTFDELKTDILGQRTDLTAALIKSALFRLIVRNSARCTEQGHWYRTASFPEEFEARLVHELESHH